MALTDAVVVIVGWLLTAYAALYGCAKVPPGAWVRWLVFVACAVVLTQFGYLPLLFGFGLRATSVSDQYAAIVLATFTLKFILERAVPFWCALLERNSYGQD